MIRFLFAISILAISCKSSDNDSEKFKNDLNQLRIETDWTREAIRRERDFAVAYIKLGMEESEYNDSILMNMDYIYGYKKGDAIYNSDIGKWYREKYRPKLIEGFKQKTQFDK